MKGKGEDQRSWKGKGGRLTKKLYVEKEGWRPEKVKYVMDGRRVEKLEGKIWRDGLRSWG